MSDDAAPFYSPDEPVTLDVDDLRVIEAAVRFALKSGRMEPDVCGMLMSAQTKLSKLMRKE